MTVISDLRNTVPGGRALIILGGYSAANYKAIREQVKPDVVMGANGTITEVDHLDHWLLLENMNYFAKKTDERSVAFMEMFKRRNADIRLVDRLSWNLVDGDTDTIQVERLLLGADLETFSFRDYVRGYLTGWVLRHEDAGVRVRVGTVGLQMLHHAAFLGCSEIHTIGFDLMFREANRHHWYKWPIYRPDHFRYESMFVEYRGVRTQWFWAEAAQYLKTIEPVLEAQGIVWRDHSDGLLKLEGLKCAS